MSFADLFLAVAPGVVFAVIVSGGQNVTSLFRKYAGDFGLRTLIQLLRGPDL